MIIINLLTVHGSCVLADCRKVLKSTIKGDGVWRIRRREKDARIEVFRVEEAGHGNILSDEFVNWRIKLAMPPITPQEVGDSQTSAE